MSPELVVWAIRALVRLGGVTANALEQKIRDRDLLLPHARSAGFSTEAWLQQIFFDPAHAPLVAPDGPLHACWDGVRARSIPPESLERLVAAAVEIEARQVGLGGPLPAPLRHENVAFAIVTQWANEARPVHPYARIVLALADVALEYVAMNPSVLGIGGTGEKLVQAIAFNLSEILPDGTDPERLGRQRRLGERLAAGLFRGALSAVATHPEYAFADGHLRSFVAQTIPPIVAALPAGEDGLEFEVSWSEVGDALLGPAAMAALSVLAEQPQALLGHRVEPGTALGAVTRAVLDTARTDGSLRRTFSGDGLIRAYRAIAAVAASAPELFIGQGDGAGDRITRDLLGGVAKVVADARPPLSRDLALGVASAALDAVGRNAGSLVRLHPDWDQTTVRLTEHVVDGLRAGLTGGASLGRVFAGDQLVQLARIVLEDVARNPAMAGLGAAAKDDPRQRLAGGIIAAVAQAMAQDRHLLLASDDWLKIVSVASREAARNPERLFRLDVNQPGEQLATRLIGHVLAAAEAGFRNGRPAEGAILFSTTLRDMIVIALEFGAEHAAAAVDRSSAVGELATRIEALSRKAGTSIGATQVVETFRAALPRLLDRAATVVADGDVDALVPIVRERGLTSVVARLVR